MLRVYYYLLFSLMTLSGFSQASNDLPVDLKTCNVQVEANMFTATTTLLMEFYNPNDKVMDGQYDFALQQGQVITGFSLDINGRLREGVIVDKKKGRVAYENTIRRRIDPGLLEMTSGNNYRVRIYPMPAKGTRTIKIIISQVLIVKNNALQYFLPFNKTSLVKEFSAAVKVSGSAASPVAHNGMLAGSGFVKQQQSFSTHLENKNFLTDQPISFHIPLNEPVRFAYSDSGSFFGLRIKTPQKQQPAVRVNSTVIFWDVSASAKKRNIKKEFAFIEKFINEKKPGELKIVTFSNSVHVVRNFAQPSATEVTRFLQAQPMDGGTQLGALDCTLYDAAVFIVFSDGLSNTGKNEIITGGKAIFAVNSSPVANHTVLQQLAQKTGGKYIDLNMSDETQALTEMFKSSIQLLDISQDGKALQVSCNLPFSADEYVTVSGLSIDTNKAIRLNFGYAGVPDFTEVIDISAAEKDKGVQPDEMYLLQKLDAMQTGFSEAPRVTAFAQQVAFVTATTSFIVLDDLDDYIEHGIVPPAELMDAYVKKRDVVERKAKELMVSKENEEISNLQKAAKLFNERIKWWGSAESLIDPATLSLPKTDMYVYGRTTPAGKKSGVDQDNDISMFSGGDGLEEVVIIGYGSRRMRSISGSVTTVLGSEIFSAGATSLASALQGRVAGLQVIPSGIPGSADKIFIRGGASLSGSGQPLYVLDGVPVDATVVNAFSPADIRSVTVIKDISASAIYGSRAVNGAIVVETNSSSSLKEKGVNRYAEQEDVDYVIALKELPDAVSMYNMYLQMRAEHEDDIAFYVDAAQVLLDAGDKKLALRVLSNLAEMDIENHQLLRGLGYVLESWKMFDEAIEVYKKVILVKEEEPQSYRDLAMAYERNGQHEQAVDLLYSIVTKNFYQYEDRYRGIKSLLLNEMNAIINRHPDLMCRQKITPAIIRPLPVDLRIVIDWNKDETDIDLHIVEPGGEKCFYGNKNTKKGGRLSEDFTQGNGPEEYQIKHAAKGRYSIMVNYYGDRYQKQQVAPFIKLTVYKNFGRPDQSVQTEVFSMLNQTGTVEIGVAKF